MKELEADDHAVVLALGLLEAAPDAILVIRAGGNIALANRMAERLFGYDRADLIGPPVEALVPHECGCQPPTSLKLRTAFGVCVLGVRCEASVG